MVTTRAMSLIAAGLGFMGMAFANQAAKADGPSGRHAIMTAGDNVGTTELVRHRGGWRHGGWGGYGYYRPHRWGGYYRPYAGRSYWGPGYGYGYPAYGYGYSYPGYTYYNPGFGVYFY